VLNQSVSFIPLRRVHLNRRTLFIGLPLALSSVLILLALDTPHRTLAAPLLALVNIAAWFFLVLWNRDSRFPVFEAGPICVAATTVYAAYPLLAFLMAGGRWTALSDNRLLHWRPDMAAIGSFAWGYVAYLAPLAAAYLYVRGRATADSIPMRSLSRSAITVMIWLIAAIAVYFAAIWIYFDVSYSPSYADVQLGRVRTVRDLPLILQQISHNLQGVLVILKLCAVALLLQRWRVPAIRVVLLGWLAIELAAMGLRMGARTNTMALLLGAGLLYHRLVRPLAAPAVAVAGAAFLSVALLYGFGRDFAGLPTEYARISFWSATNEFQTLLGTAYDLFRLRDTGALDDVPWQVGASELLMLIPSQFLPVPKIDPGEWYASTFHAVSGGGGLMFGVMAQAAVGYGSFELIVRGTLLGVFLGLFHRLYVHHAHSFWATLLYVYICVWSYYTFRAATFYFVYVVLYRFVPTMIVVRAGAGLVRGVSKDSRGTIVTATREGMPCAGS
jgi:hypothetical protein